MRRAPLTMSLLLLPSLAAAASQCVVQSDELGNCSPPSLNELCAGMAEHC